MNPHFSKTVIVIAGPTGVGKTDVAIRLAKHFQTEIISADSRQCYKELNIGVARPSVEELKEITHHFIASHSVQEEVNAVVFEAYALKKADELFKKHNVIIMAGGTGLYIKAFCEGMDDIPPINPETRSNIVEQYESRGIGWLQEEIQKKDPEFYQAGEIKNPQRIMRALEVIESTGQSILFFRKGKKAERDFNIIKIALELPKEELHRNINTRVDKMIAAGLEEEVKSVAAFRHLNALQTVGYTEIFDYLDDKISLEQSGELIKKNTRQYAKRQLTWFRRDKEFRWFSPAAKEQIIVFAEKNLKHTG